MIRGSEPEIAQAVRRRLRDMGDSPDKVAAYLRDAGLTGARYAPSGTPLDKALRDALTARGYRIDSIRINGLGSSVTITAEPDVEVLVYLTPAAATFLRRFDNHQYPDLVASPSQILGRQQ